MSERQEILQDILWGVKWALWFDVAFLLGYWAGTAS